MTKLPLRLPLPLDLFLHFPPGGIRLAFSAAQKRVLPAPLAEIEKRRALLDMEIRGLLYKLLRLNVAKIPTLSRNIIAYSP